MSILSVNFLFKFWIARTKVDLFVMYVCFFYNVKFTYVVHTWGEFVPFGLYELYFLKILKIMLIIYKYLCKLINSPLYNISQRSVEHVHYLIGVDEILGSSCLIIWPFCRKTSIWVHLQNFANDNGIQIDWNCNFFLKESTWKISEGCYFKTIIAKV